MEGLRDLKWNEEPFCDPKQNYDFRRTYDSNTGQRRKHDEDKLMRTESWP